MAPTICLAELTTANDDNASRASSSYARRRQRGAKNSNVVAKEQRRVELRRIFNNPTNPDRAANSLTPPASPVWEPTCPTNSFSHTRNSISNSDTFAESTDSGNLDCNQRWRAILARREGLLDIVARTMALVRRSHMLQKRVNALRYETREFIRSVLNNPENNNAGKRLADVKSRGITSMDVSSSSSSSSYSEAVSSRPITPPPTPDSSTEYIHTSDYDNSHSSSSDYSSDDNSGHMSGGEVDQDPMVSSS